MGKKVTVVGAGFYGSTTAQRLAEYDVFDTVVITDIVEGKPEGLALDLNQSRPIEGFETKVVGVTTGPNGEGYEAIEGSDVVVITAGLPRKPGMSRMDLLETNAKIVRQVAENVAKYAPNAVVIVVSNPLDEMTALAQLATQFPKNRVLGQAGMLDTARFTNFVAEALGVPVASVKTLTLGSHGDTMVPVPSQCTVDGKPLRDVMPAEKIEELVVRTRNGGAEVVALLKTGSAYYAPSAAAARMAKAVAEDSGEVMPVCAWVDGEYGISGVYLGVEAEIGAEGVKRVVETDLDADELRQPPGGRRGRPRQAGRHLQHVVPTEPPEGPAGKPAALPVPRAPTPAWLIKRFASPRPRFLTQTSDHRVGVGRPVITGSGGGSGVKGVARWGVARTVGEWVRRAVRREVRAQVRVHLMGVRQVGVDELHGVHQQVAGDQHPFVGRGQEHRLVARGVAGVGSRRTAGVRVVSPSTTRSWPAARRGAIRPAGSPGLSVPAASSSARCSR